MLPELFRIPFLNLPVHTYGVMYVLGLLVGMFVAYRQALLGKKYFNDMMDFGFFALLGALLGARILFIIVESDYYFVKEPFTNIPVLNIPIPTIFAIWKGGFVFWGGAVGGIIALIIFCKKRNLPLGLLADYSALGLSLGHGIGRLGCVAGGCCFGRTSYHLNEAHEVIADNPFALVFPKKSIAYNFLYNQASSDTLKMMEKLNGTLPLFPVQILEAIGNVMIFAILLFMTPLKRVNGQIGLFYLILYSAMRAFTETLRGDSERGFVLGGLLSTSQFISLLMSLIALIFMIFLYKSSQKKINV